MDKAKLMLAANAAWASETALRNPDALPALALGQRPQVLWIGCSDSRVPAEMITHCTPGELFVHRNIANLFQPTDDNEMSVLEYAVLVLEVSHIIVCGHHGCGGVRASLGAAPTELPHVCRRIAPLRALAERHAPALQALSEEAAVDRLAELNVIEQVKMLRNVPIVRNRKPKPPLVHGWIFNLAEGRLKPLVCGDAERSDDDFNQQSTHTLRSVA